MVPKEKIKNQGKVESESEWYPDPGLAGEEIGELTLSESEQLPNQPIPNPNGGDEINGSNIIIRSINTLVQSVHQWQIYQREIRQFPDITRSKLREIERKYALYRLSFSAIQFKSEEIDSSLRENYNSIITSIPELEEKSQKRPLFLYTNTGLRELHKSWVDLQSQQNDLANMLVSAPEEMEDYNQVQVRNQRLREEDQRRKENDARIEAAYESLRKAMTYVERQVKSDEPMLFGNEVMTTQDALDLWNQKINDILTLRNESETQVERIIKHISSLEEAVREYPSLSKQVQRVGERFSRMVAYHDLLASSGKRIIPQAEITRASALMYEQIPTNWSGGDYENVKVLLEKVENFLNFYENTVELEVAIGERRRAGFAQTLPPAVRQGTSGLSSMINLARVLVAAIDQRDRYMAGHSENVARLSVLIGKKLNWSGSDLEFLEIAALLHDIGKISISENILTKVQPLTSEEWKTIQMHPYYGAQIVKQINIFNRIVPWVYHHQEHYDGSGYPDHLSKSDIPDGAAIIAITEAFTVMTSDLPYRQGVTFQEAIEEIKEDSEKQFNPEVVEAFEEIVRDLKTTNGDD